MDTYSIFVKKVIHLPQDIQMKILEYGDPMITRNMRNVFIQLSFLRNEFEYLRKTKNNSYYGWKSKSLWKFYINRTRDKLMLNIPSHKLRKFFNKWCILSPESFGQRMYACRESLVI